VISVVGTVAHRPASASQESHFEAQNMTAAFVPDANAELRSLLAACHIADDPCPPLSALVDWLEQHSDPRSVVVWVGTRLWQLAYLNRGLTKKEEAEQRQLLHRVSTECSPILKEWLGFPISWIASTRHPGFGDSCPLLFVQIKGHESLPARLSEAFAAGWVWKLLVCGPRIDRILANVLATTGPIRHLAFCGNEALTDDDLSVLPQFPHLRELDFLETRLSDEGLPHLYSIMALREVSLYDTRVTEAGIAALSGALPECSILY
jgi:hypothetical protein